MLPIFLALSMAFSASPGSENKGVIHSLLHKSEIIAESHTGTPSAERFDPTAEFTFDGVPVIRPKNGKEVRILSLDDIHFSDYGYRLPLMPLHISFIRRLAKSVEPDLIIIPGDMVCGESSVRSVSIITELMNSIGVPFAPVFGNHDEEANCDLDYLAETMMSSPLCLMKKGDPEMGVGNYLVNIAAADGSIAETLFMMYSHHSSPNQKQCEWFRWAADGVSRLTDGKAEISLYMHIPLPEYQLAFDEAWDAGSKSWKSGYSAAGELHESICCERSGGTALPSPLFEAIKSFPNAKYVFCAHDHMNDFSIMYQGVRLTYLMKLGFSSGFQVGFNGGSVISVGNEGISSIKHLVFRLGIKELENISTVQ